MGQEKAVSLSLEFETLEHALGGIRSLLDSAIHQSVTIRDHERVLTEGNALLALVATRIRDLDRVVRGSMAPALFVTRWNRALPSMDMQDVHLSDRGHRVRKEKTPRPKTRGQSKKA